MEQSHGDLASGVSASSSNSVDSQRDGQRELGSSQPSYDLDVNPTRPLLLVTTLRWFISWIVAHVLYLVAGGATGVYLFAVPGENTVLRSLLAAAAMAFAGAGAYYLRRVYKAAIQGMVQLITRDEARGRRPRVIGTSTYILLRPVIAAILSVFAAMTVAVTWSGLTPMGTTPTHGLVELASVYGFAVGFFSGRSLKQLESSGKITP